MCVEVYSTDQPIQIPYENENIRFTSPRAYGARHTFLVRNAGFRPIDKLSVLYPRFLYHLDTTPGHRAGHLRLTSFDNQTERMPSLHPNATATGDNYLVMDLADPNNPMCNLPTLRGYWDHSNIEVDYPKVVTENPLRSRWLFSTHHFSAWNVKLQEPIRPGDAHWFMWEFDVSDAGDPLEDSVHGPIVFHELASPIDVRRTVVETLQSALSDSWNNAQNTPPTEPDYGRIIARETRAQGVFEGLMKEMGIGQERRVDIQYYELTIETGDPRSQYLCSVITQGDIRLRSGSPRVDHRPGADRASIGEPVYEWKSGSILEPSHPWKNTGFSLRLALSHPRPPSAPPDKPGGP